MSMKPQSPLRGVKKKKGKKWDQSYNNDYKNTKQVND
jgi:hypothetical protein